MLLTDLTRGLAQRDRERDREAGSALAGVIGILAATGVVAATLLAVAVFGAGFTSASRAGVQAQAAAEGGLEYARANLALCDTATGAVASPSGTVPRFDVEVWWRYKIGAPWTRGCAPADAIQVRLVSRGVAAQPGAADHSRGNLRAMEAVYGYEFPFMALGDRSISLTGSLTVHDTDARPADMSTNNTFTCGGGFTLRGILYVAGTTSGCAGKTIVGGFDTTVRPHAMPRFTRTDARWPRTSASLPGGTCTQTGTTLNLSRSAVECTAQLKLSGVQIVLTGDVVLFAPTIALDDVNIRSVGGRYSIYFVKPWPAAQTQCAATDHIPDIGAKKVVTDDFSSVMMYSSAEVQLDSPEGLPLRAQLYGCQVDTKGSPKLALSPVGPLVLLSKRDVTG